MKESLLPLLACPACGGPLGARADERDGDEIATGSLICERCGASVPVRGGVPRFVPSAVSRTSQRFGAQWTMFDAVADRDDRQFRAWIAPVTPAFVSGRTVVELGCGKGRHTRLLAQWGARAVVAVDISEAVDVAYRHTRDLPHVLVIQADITRLPLARVFDYGFSIGVLHHLDNPAAGFRALVDCVRPSGAVSCWVYGRENNGWIVRGLDPARRLVFSRLPPAVLYPVSAAAGAILWAAITLVYRPLAGTRIGDRLFYAAYLQSISELPFRDIVTIVYDHLNAPVAHYLTRDDVQAWFQREGLQRVTIAWHNQNSWRALGFVAAQPAPVPCAASAESST